MIAAPVPPDEPQRLARLRALAVLDTPPEAQLDRIVQLAADVAGMPIAAVSLIDSDRQWFKARVGLDACQTPRDVSFCGHAVASRQSLVVPDALADTRFHDNPLVTGAPHVRAYVGLPLLLPGGQAVGTLCVIDHEPRALSASQLAVLDWLRRLAVEQLVRLGERAATARSRDPDAPPRQCDPARREGDAQA